MESELEPVHAVSRRISWARLLKRVFDFDMQHCPNCGGGELKFLAAILERPVIDKILTHLGLDPQPPPKGRTREAGPDFANEPRRRAGPRKHPATGGDAARRAGAARASQVQP